MSKADVAAVRSAVRIVISVSKIGIDRIEVRLRAQARDLALDAEDRMGDLTGDHIDLVRIGRGDDHIRISRARTIEHIGIACEPCNTLHVQSICCAANEISIAVHDSHVIALAREVACDLPTDLPCTANNDFHDVEIPCCAGRAGHRRHACA